MNPTDEMHLLVQCGELGLLALLAHRERIRLMDEWDDCEQRLLFDPRFPFAPTCEYGQLAEALQKLAGEVLRSCTRVGLGIEEAEPGRLGAKHQGRHRDFDARAADGLSHQARCSMRHGSFRDGQGRSRNVFVRSLLKSVAKDLAGNE